MLSLSSLSNRIYSNLEDRILPELISQDCTEKNIQDVKSKLRQEADSIAAGVIDEIHQNGEVVLKEEVMILKSIVSGIIDAIVSAPVVPMDGGLSFKMGLISMVVPYKAQLALILGDSSIS